MKKNSIVFLLICACVLSFIFNNIIYTSASAMEEYSCARGMCVLEGNSNKVLYCKNLHERMPMASTTKIVTAILAIENTPNLDEKIKISEKAVGIEGTSIYIKSGEELTMRELLYGLMLASGNDCAVAIAEVCGGEENFVNMMNEFALNLGLTDTHFDNPHGLDSETHYTSAYDLAMMTSYALENDTFREIFGTERMVIEENEIYQARYLKNKNRLLFTEENCIGGKTGFTDNAGRCLVSAHEENDMTIISVVLNCQPMFDECNRLTKLVLQNYNMKEFIKPYNFVSDVIISDSDKQDVGVITIKGYSEPILKSEESNYEVKYNLPESLVAPIKLNEEVGTVEVYYNNEVIYTDKLITIEGAENNDIKYLFDNIIDKWF